MEGESLVAPPGHGDSVVEVQTSTLLENPAWNPAQRKPTVPAGNRIEYSHPIRTGILNIQVLLRRIKPNRVLRERSTRSILNRRPERSETRFNLEGESLVTPPGHGDSVVEAQASTLLLRSPAWSLAQRKPTVPAGNRIEYSHPIRTGTLNIQFSLRRIKPNRVLRERSTRSILNRRPERSEALL